MADSLEYRNRFFVSSILFVGILFGILTSIYFLGNTLSGAKLDLTQDKIFTISRPTKEILDELTDDIIVRYYASEEVPSFLVNLKRDTLDMFREMELLSNGHFKYEVIAPEEEARRHAVEKVQEYFEFKDKGQTPKEPQQQETIEDLFMGRGRVRKTDPEISEERRKKAEILAGRKKGNTTVDDEFRHLLREEFEQTYLADLQRQSIYPVPVEERQASKAVETNFYSAIEIKYLEKQPEVIPVHYQMQALEYELASKILKLTRKAKPKVVFFDGRKPEMPPPSPMNPMMQPPASEYSGIIQALGELFDIDEISLKEGNSLSDIQKRLEEDLKKTDDDRSREEKPDRISCLVVAQPHELEARQVFEISKAVSEGIPTVFLVSSYTADMSQSAVQRQFPITILRHGLDDLMRSWGITLGKDILASKDCAPAMVPQRLGPIAVLAPHPMPILVKAVNEAINQRHSLTNRIQSLIFPSAVGLSIHEEDLKKAGLQVAELANSGKQSYTVQVSMFEQDMFNRVQTPAVLRNKKLFDKREHREGFIDSKPLAVLVEGTFPFKYQDQPIPEWKKEEKDKGKKEDDIDFPDLPGPKGPEGPQEGKAPEEKKDPASPAAVDPASPPAPSAPEPAPSTAASPQAPTVGGEKKADEKKAEEKKEPEKVHLEVKKGRAMILTSVDMMKNDYLMQRGDYQSNVTFFYNTIETFGLDERLLQIRRKELTERQFKAGSGESKAPEWIQLINIGLLPLGVGLFGLAQFWRRRFESNAYERQYIEKNVA